MLLLMMQLLKDPDFQNKSENLTLFSEKHTASLNCLANFVIAVEFLLYFIKEDKQ